MQIEFDGMRPCHTDSQAKPTPIQAPRKADDMKGWLMSQAIIDSLTLIHKTVRTGYVAAQPGSGQLPLKFSPNNNTTNKCNQGHHDPVETRELR